MFGTRTHTHAYTHSHTHAYTCMCTYTWPHACIRLHIHLRIHTLTSSHACMHIHTYVGNKDKAALAEGQGCCVCGEEAEELLQCGICLSRSYCSKACQQVFFARACIHVCVHKQNSLSLKLSPLTYRLINRPHTYRLSRIVPGTRIIAWGG